MLNEFVKNPLVVGVIAAKPLGMPLIGEEVGVLWRIYRLDDAVLGSRHHLKISAKGLDRLMKAVDTLAKVKPQATSTVDVSELERRCAEAMADDLNSPMVISALFDWVRIINQAAEGAQSLTAEDLDSLKATVNRYVFDILGLRNEKAAESGGKDMVSPLVDMLLNMRMEAKANKDWATSDKIRDNLTAIGIRVKDRKDGFDWEIE